MATGTPTLSDSYWLGQSTVFKNRVQSALLTYCNTVNTEVPTGVTGSIPTTIHLQRKSFVSNILNPSTFANWLGMFTFIAACDANVISAATQATTSYTAITTAAQGDTAAADGQSPNVTTTLINNAIAASFNSFVGGI